MIRLSSQIISQIICSFVTKVLWSRTMARKSAAVSWSGGDISPLIVVFCPQDIVHFEWLVTSFFADSIQFWKYSTILPEKSLKICELLDCGRHFLTPMIFVTLIVRRSDAPVIGRDPWNFFFDKLQLLQIFFQTTNNLQDFTEKFYWKNTEKITGILLGHFGIHLDRFHNFQIDSI